MLCEGRRGGNEFLAVVAVRRRVAVEAGHAGREGVSLAASYSPLKREEDIAQAVTWQR